MGVGSLGLVVLWLLPLTLGQNQTAKSTEDRPTPRGRAGWRSVSELAGKASPASTMSAPPGSTPPRSHGSTEGSESTTEKPSNATPPSDSTGTTRPPGSSAQTPSAADGPTQPPTRPTPSTSLTPTTSTGPAENQTASTSPVPRGTPRATPKTPRATPKTPRATPKTPDGSYHGKVVAGLIGGALLVMVVGFLLIYVKKRRLQKQQMETGDWAGPSPFLAGGASGPAAAARPSNRLSLAGFLRLSRRLSALPETGEEFVMVTTFGRKASSLPREDAGAAGLRSNGHAPETAEHNNNTSEQGGAA
ncbi:nascent polypeptide-associated complex subunit alpha, muscle-specific form-like [Pseudoliparis swirei]|uniref:nascent polypeptide-associated complex subunit alpha, muscle-specific form-like n=1 Tax=Pseudoliparis swirei TaxID=2059687 RepID=UPI0024BE9316|nr:nascent polypeptide-associated complex subunit alpha, muscle-specific form-like [Pseudoliparis swirei]